MAFGDGLGGLIGVLGSKSLSNSQANINNDVNQANAHISDIAGGFQNTTQPYNQFGQSFLPTAANAIGGVSSAAGSTQGYDQFMSHYTNTPAAQYQLQQADQVQNNSAAAKGGLLSGANERALGTINTGIVAQNANTAYDEYLKGNSTQFGQLEQALGSMFSAIGVGQTATGQQEALDASQIGATASLGGAQVGATSQIGQAQARNDTTIGNGLGSLFSGLGAMSFAF